MLELIGAAISLMATLVLVLAAVIALSVVVLACLAGLAVATGRDDRPALAKRLIHASRRASRRGDADGTDGADGADEAAATGAPTATGPAGEGRIRRDDDRAGVRLVVARGDDGRKGAGQSEAARAGTGSIGTGQDDDADAEPAAKDAGQAVPDRVPAAVAELGQRIGRAAKGAPRSPAARAPGHERQGKAPRRVTKTTRP